MYEYLEKRFRGRSDSEEQSIYYISIHVRCILKDNGYSRQFKKDSQQDYFTGLKRLCTEIGISIY